MKKYLLLSVAALAATSGFAQVEKASMQKISKQNAATFSTFERAKAGSAIKKSYANQTYYLPQGSYYGGWTMEGNGAGAAVLCVPPFTDVTFTNMMNDPLSGSWLINGNDASSLADKNGNCVMTTAGGGMYYAPTLVNGQIQYTFGENNYYYIKGQITSLASAGILNATNTMSFNNGTSVQLPMYAMNDHGSRTSKGQTYQNILSGYGFIDDSKYLFGSGTVTGDDNQKAKITNVYQIFNAPGADLYVENFFIQALTFNANGPIPAGKKVTAYITNVVESENGGLVPGDEILATFSATSDDCTDFTESITGWASEGQFAGKEPKGGSVTFYNEDTDKDPLTGAESPKPIVIPTGKQFAIVISGLDNDGIDLGIAGIMSNEEDNGERAGINVEGGITYTYQNKLGLQLGLNATFEKIDVPSKGFLTSESSEGFPADKFNGWNVLRVSDDGKTVSTDGMESTDYDLGAALVGTASSWFDTDETPIYSIESASESDNADWITSFSIDNQYWETQTLTGYNLVIPVCQALPSGVKGRTAYLTVYGRGDVQSNNKIVVLQGDAKYDVTGIDNAVVTNNTKKSNRMFNLAGQQVDKNYKGLVIKNGQKFINK